MSAASPPHGALARMAQRSRRWLLDPKLWLGLAVTAGALWYAFRDVDLGALAADLGRANLWWMVAVAAPAHVWSIDLRARRWRHLAAGVAAFDLRTSFRATAIGFMANNVFPLRLGELVRAVVLARDTGAPTAALLGTLIVERALDVCFVVALALVLVGPRGAAAAGVDPVLVLAPLGVGLAALLAVIAALRAAPARVLRLAEGVFRVVLPGRFRDGAQRLLESLAAGLGGIRNGRDLAWVLVQSALLWWVAVVLTFWAALKAMGIELGGLLPELSVAGQLMVWVGLAVALPSAPGFVGPFHAACRVALVPLGIGKEQALALGTLAHATFWVTITLLGLLMLRSRGSRLEDALEATDTAAAAGDGDAAPHGEQASVRPAPASR